MIMHPIATPSVRSYKIPLNWNRDLFSECIEKVNKFYESGHTPSTASEQHLTELRAAYGDRLTYHKKNADRFVTPSKPPIFKFGEEKFGGKGPLIFEKHNNYKKSHPGATATHKF